MPKPTKQDADVLLKLVELAGSPRSQEARNWFLKSFDSSNYEEFKTKYPEGSVEYSHVTTLLGFYETVGVLVTHGLLNEDLCFDLNFGLSPLWKKLGPIVKGWQKATSPALWENAVWLAERSEAWAKSTWTPGLTWKMNR
jgi:Domain of unknown function (DUF4760)